MSSCCDYTYDCRIQSRRKRYHDNIGHEFIEDVGKLRFVAVMLDQGDGVSWTIKEEMYMGFTFWLAIVYVLLIIITAIAFAKKKKVIGVIGTLIMVVGIVVLGYLWITSPM